MGKDPRGAHGSHSSSPDEDSRRPSRGDGTGLLCDGVPDKGYETETPLPLGDQTSRFPSVGEPPGFGAGAGVLHEGADEANLLGSVFADHGLGDALLDRGGLGGYLRLGCRRIRVLSLLRRTIAPEGRDG